MNRLFVVDCEYGDIGEYRLEKRGNRYVAVEGDWPFDKDDIWLTYDEDGSLRFHIYEGCHWERGDRDDSTEVPGYLEDYFLTLSEEEAHRISEEAKGRHE